jgi:putative tryptophan/tyrosine transport system substrate-binding protein
MLEALKKVAPEVNHVVVIYYPVQSPQIGRLAAIQTAAASLSVQVSSVSAGNTDQIRDGIEGIGNETRKGVVVLANPITIANRDLIIALLARHHLPAVYDQPLFVRAGGLVSYGADPVIQWQQAASYVDRILKGAKPADLPVQQATKFELTINLKTAKALGLTVPLDLLNAADEVIE